MGHTVSLLGDIQSTTVLGSGVDVQSVQSLTSKIRIYHNNFMCLLPTLAYYCLLFPNTMIHMVHILLLQEVKSHEVHVKSWASLQVNWCRRQQF